MRVLEFFKGLFPDPVKRTHDEHWTRNEIYKALHDNGVIIERARRREAHLKSLNKAERMRVNGARWLANEINLTREYINAAEMEGERDWDAVLRPVRVVAKFAFYNFGEHPSNPMPDFHIVESNHPALIVGGNYSLLDFMDADIKPPKYPTYEKWVKNGRPIFRGCL